ncbi:MAG: CxxxxCH/CxxCH domain-containing protein [Kofleriaceae bacterium]
MKWSAMLIVLAACSTERELPDAEPVTGVHPSGILDEQSPNFHGAELARRGYDLGLCAKCHGDDFAGGAAKMTCLTCHPSGPDACTTCHRDGPTTGAHAVHRVAGQDCGECHVVPARWDAPGHVLGDAAPAEVTFGARAAQTLAPADRAGPPEYAAGTCTNVYCHGDVLHAGGGTNSRPRWDDPTPAGDCTTCHGAPPPSHMQSECTSCHRAAPHLDGIVQVGVECNSCHGDATSAAPPRDLAGNTFTTAIGVGAHRAHLDGASRLRAPLACTECHRVPLATSDAGHLDSPPPAEVVTSAGWDRASATCANGCHGFSAPVWTAGPSQVFCGSCHGVPPVSASHTAAMTIGTCTTCHPRTVDAFGNIVFVNMTTTHMNGAVDVQ